VDTTATVDEIKNAYRRLIRTYHPDRNGEENANSITADINESYAVLADHQRRESYDAELKLERPNAFTTFDGTAKKWQPAAFEDEQPISAKSAQSGTPHKKQPTESENTCFAELLLAEEYLEAVAFARNHLESRSPETNFERQKAELNLGRALIAAGYYIEARSILSKVLICLNREQHIDGKLLAITVEAMIGQTLAHGKDLAEDQAGAIFSRLMRKLRGFASSTEIYWDAVDQLASLAKYLFRFEEAETLYLNYLYDVSGCLPPNHIQIADNLCGQAAIRNCLHKYDDALGLYKRALSMYQTTSGKKRSLLVAKCLGQIAYVYIQLGQKSEATACLLAHLQAVPKNSLPRCDSNILAALLAENEGDIPKAIYYWDQTEEALRRTCLPSANDYIIYCGYRASYALQREAYTETIECMNAAIRHTLDLRGTNHPTVACCKGLLGAAVYKSGEPEMAIPLLEQAYSVLTQAQRTDYQRVFVACARNLYSVYVATKAFDKIIGLSKDLLAKHDKVSFMEDSWRAEVLLAMCNLRLEPTGFCTKEKFLQ